MICPLWTVTVTLTYWPGRSTKSAAGRFSTATRLTWQIRQFWRGFSRTAARAGLTLDGSGHETTHVVTMQQQEQDQARDGHHHNASLRGTVIDGAHRLLPQVGHRQRQGLLCAVG